MRLAPLFGLRIRRLAEFLKAKHANTLGLIGSITLSSSELARLRRGRDWPFNRDWLERLRAVHGVRVNGCKVASAHNGPGSAV